MNKQTIAETIKDLQERYVVPEFPETMSWDDFVQQRAELVGEDKKLKELLKLKKREDMVEETSLDNILRLNFMSAKALIEQMSLAKRIQVLEEAHGYRDYLYLRIGQFGAEGVKKDEQITAAEFRSLLGRVKHLEILQSWLYGIE